MLQPFRSDAAVAAGQPARKVRTPQSCNCPQDLARTSPCFPARRQRGRAAGTRHFTIRDRYAGARCSHWQRGMCVCARSCPPALCLSRSSGPPQRGHSSPSRCAPSCGSKPPCPAAQQSRAAPSASRACRRASGSTKRARVVLRTCVVRDGQFAVCWPCAM